MIKPNSMVCIWKTTEKVEVHNQCTILQGALTDKIKALKLTISTFMI